MSSDVRMLGRLAAYEATVMACLAFVMNNIGNDPDGSKSLTFVEAIRQAARERGAEDGPEVEKHAGAIVDEMLRKGWWQTRPRDQTKQ